ncbi:GerAB/ArcD/ProY family transporter [Paenibacillus radicis (ex Gao et al. 2016)]|uniref:Germination protein n=1 Tax=Paenibacillus radicis (ex Gao et al. 2016) TaxID=1737354 RepID=A0A917GXX2_9BACL|nr:endospore germination permease [Paenibacillus radicis (ex Gao et al. 2016)]GGG60532.1 germination protein [Paenibacillus radicis (ex Gao et al. 2016)]
MDLSDKMTPLQAAGLLALLIATQNYIFAPAIMARFAHEDMWISSLLAASAAFLFCLYAVWLAGQFPNRTLIQFLSFLLGRWAGKAIGILYLGYFICLTVIYVQTLATSFKTLFLPMTPLIVFIVLIVLFCMYGAAQGIIVLGKMSTLVILALLVTLLLLFAGTLPSVEMTNYLPIGENRWSNTFYASLFNLTSFTQSIVITMLFAFVPSDKMKYAKKYVVWGSMLTFGVTSLIVIEEVGVFSPNQLELLTFPTVELITLFNFGTFFERVETIFVSVWGAAMFLVIGILFTSCLTAIRHLLGRSDGSDSKWLVLLFGAVILFLSLFYLNNTQKLSYFMLHYWTYLSLVFQVGIPLLLGLACLIARRRMSYADNANA